MEFWTLNTPIGTLSLGEEDGFLVRLYLPNEPTPRLMAHKTPLLEQAEQQLQEYFRGERQIFDLPLQPCGTPFQKQVWNALQFIPYGETRSYKELAVQVGCSGGGRAIGMANHKNPLPILIPCHRVICQNGTLGGYHGSINLKQVLLNLERDNRKK